MSSLSYLLNPISLDQIITLLNGFGLDTLVPLVTMDTKELVQILEGLLYVNGALKFLAASQITGDLFCTPNLMHCLGRIHEVLDLFLRDLNTHSDPALAEPVYHVLLQVIKSNEIFTDVYLSSIRRNDVW